MKEFIILVLKGILIGIGKIIPGVSGAMIAITLGIYEKGLEIVSNIFKSFIKNIKFIIGLGTGFIVGILVFSKIVVNLLDNFYLPTMLLFVGLITGGISSFKKNVNLKKKTNILYFIFTIIIILILSMLKQSNTATYNFYILIIMGFIEAMSMIIPGLSGTALLMTFGYYEIIMKAFSEIEIMVLIPFVIGIVLGAIIISKIATYLFKNYREKTDVVIYGLSVASILTLLLQTLNNNYNIYEIIISLVLLVIGYNISKFMEK